MQHTRRSLSLIGAGLITTVAIAIGIAHAATPSTPVQAKPTLALTWLSSLKVTPASVLAGSDVTGSLTLLRPALEALEVTLELQTAQLNQMIPDNGARATSPKSVFVRANSTGATFRINTVAGDTSNIILGPGLPKTITITARYGDETKTASFTLANPSPAFPEP